MDARNPNNPQPPEPQSNFWEGVDAAAKIGASSGTIVGSIGFGIAAGLSAIPTYGLGAAAIPAAMAAGGVIGGVVGGATGTILGFIIESIKWVYTFYRNMEDNNSDPDSEDDEIENEDFSWNDANIATFTKAGAILGASVGTIGLGIAAGLSAIPTYGLGIAAIPVAMAAGSAIGGVVGGAAGTIVGYASESIRWGIYTFRNLTKKKTVAASPPKDNLAENKDLSENDNPVATFSKRGAALGTSIGVIVFGIAACLGAVPTYGLGVAAIPAAMAAGGAIGGVIGGTAGIVVGLVSEFVKWGVDIYRGKDAETADIQNALTTAIGAIPDAVNAVNTLGNAVNKTASTPTNTVVTQTLNLLTTATTTTTTTATPTPVATPATAGLTRRPTDMFPPKPKSTKISQKRKERSQSQGPTPTRRRGDQEI